MHSVEAHSENGQCVQQVARKFVALYYTVLNSYSDFLFQFYGPDSTVAICQHPDNGMPETTRADTMSGFLGSFYEDVTIHVRNCTPQPSSGGCLSLLVTGLMSRKQVSEDRVFTQALILSRQRDGYYIRTDTVLIAPLSKWLAGGNALLSTIPIATEKGKEVAEEVFKKGHAYATMAQSCKPVMEVPHDRIPSVDVVSGIGLYGTSQKHPQQMSGPTESLDGTKQIQDGFVAYNVARGTTNDPRYAIIGSDKQGCALMGRNGAVRNGQYFMPVSIGPNCNSLGYAGVAHLSVDRIGVEPHPHPHPSCFFQASTPISDENQRNPTDPHKLFACKLPLGIDGDVVTETFSKYGTLAEGDSVRVFNGQNHSYACVTYQSDADLQRALGSEIRISDTVVVTEAWCPRDRMKRRRSGNTQQKAAEKVAK